MAVFWGIVLEYSDNLGRSLHYLGTAISPLVVNSLGSTHAREGIIVKRFVFLLTLLALATSLLVNAYAEDYRIRSGDNLGITVLGEQDLTKHVLVDPNGNISLPLTKDIHIAGLSLTEAAEEITKQLKQYIKNPQVSLELIAPAKMHVTISGEVKAPGVYPVSAGARLMDAITLAGGYTPVADLTRVAVSKPGDSPTTVDLSRFIMAGDATVNLPIVGGDTIYVPTKETEVIGTVTVLGAVRQPGQHQIIRGMTVREAVMLAGGPTEIADLSSVSVRHVGSSDTTPIDYIAASAGNPGANPELKPGDVVYIGARGQLGFYTIYGSVANPGRYELRDKTSITEAIAMAGGVKDRAKLGEVRILRNSDGNPSTLKANVSSIMDGKSPNLPIRDQDSIYVPAKKDKPDYMRILSIGVSLGWLLIGR